MSIPIQYNNQIPVTNGGDPINQLLTDKINPPKRSEDYQFFVWEKLYYPRAYVWGIKRFCDICDIIYHNSTTNWQCDLFCSTYN